jgi:DNA-binding response OmpR family regulator
MPYEQPLPSSTILLIEADPSLRRLMTLGLEQNGVDVIETCSLDLAPLTAQSCDLVVLDVDRGMTSDWSQLEKIQNNPQLASLPIVVLTWEGPCTSSCTMLSPSTTSTSMVISTCEQIVLLDKPFDARTLYRTIRKLLVSRAAQKAALEALAEARILALYSQHAVPSIWPVVTAAGLLLAVIGWLFHIVIAIAGILIVMIALLLWTLGAKSETVPMAIAMGK